MAIKLICAGRSGPDGTILQYACDEVADVERLPRGQADGSGLSRYLSPAPGSTAIVDENRGIYWLPPSRTWSLLLTLPE